MAVNHLIKMGLESKDPYWKSVYLSPVLKQGKRNVWSTFQEYTSHFPHGLINFNASELSIKLPTGGIIYLLGADDPMALKGMHNDFAVLDEVAQMPHVIWQEVIYPTLQAKKGGALFIGTPRGKNLFHNLYQRGAKGEKEHEEYKDSWESFMFTAESSGVMTQEEREEHSKEMGEELYKQEMLCSFTAADKNFFYARKINQLWEEGRMTTGLHKPDLKVITSWDLGVNDPTAIWFAQINGDDVHLIDYYENRNITELDHYIQVCRNKGYDYDYHILPHDIEQRHLGMGLTRTQQIEKAGFRIRRSPKLSVMEGINAVRYILSRCRFDMSMAHEGVRHLSNYRSKYNERYGVEQQQAVHDRASNCADAFRYLATTLRTNRKFAELNFVPWIHSEEPKTNSQYELYDPLYDE